MVAFCISLLMMMMRYEMSELKKNDDKRGSRLSADACLDYYCQGGQFRVGRKDT